MENERANGDELFTYNGVKYCMTEFAFSYKYYTSIEYLTIYFASDNIKSLIKLIYFKNITLN